MTKVTVIKANQLKFDFLDKNWQQLIDQEWLARSN